VNVGVCVCVSIGILYYFSSTANPILYNLMSRKFRAAFRRTVCCWVRCGACSRRTRTLIPVRAPAPVVADGAGRRRVPLRRPGNNGLVPALAANNDPAADDCSANDGLLLPTQVNTRCCLHASFLADRTAALMNAITLNNASD